MTSTLMYGTNSRLSNRLALAVTVLVLLAWSIYAYATVRVNADIVAEAIQVQRWIADPWWVWSYPGQRHGGVLEYPLIAVAEWFSPGNVYGFTLIRIAYIPLVGLLLGLSIHWAFPSWSLWPFAAAAAAGPAVLHGFRMISDIYPFGWLLSASGVALIYASLSGRIPGAHRWVLGAGGVLIGAGIYEHASAAVFSFALLAGAITRWWVPVHRMVPIAIGLAIGLIPMVIALIAQPDLHVVYSPANPSFPDLLGVTGLVTEADSWRQALLPNGWGVQHADETLLGIPGSAQVIVNALALIATILLIAPIITLLRRREAALATANPASFVATLWTIGVAVLVLEVTIVTPIWYYATGLGFLVWITAAALPQLVRPALAGVLVVIFLFLTGLVSLQAVFLAQPMLIEGAQFKLGQARFNENIATQVEQAGVTYLYGDYWEVLPIVYASAGALTPITYDTNRFALPESMADDTIVVGLTSGYLATPPTLPRWTTAYLAESNVTDNCVERQDINTTMPDGVRAFECSVAVLDTSTHRE